MNKRRALSLPFLMVTLLAINGCHRGNSQGDEASEGSLMEPTACSQPIPDDLLLPDGTVADVRIIRVGKTLLYVPFQWLTESSQLVRDEKSGTSTAGGFKPEIRATECPGIVHTAPEDIAGYNEIRLFFRRGGEFSSPSISPSSLVDAVYITNGGAGSGAHAETMANDANWSSVLRAQNDPPNRQGWHKVDGNTFLDNSAHQDALNRWFIAHTRYFGGASASQWVLPDVMLRYNAPIGEQGLSQWRTLRDPMRELGTWLATPPRQRDNWSIFQLGKKGDPMDRH